MLRAFREGFGDGVDRAFREVEERSRGQYEVTNPKLGHYFIIEAINRNVGAIGPFTGSDVITAARQSVLNDHGVKRILEEHDY